MPSSEQNVQECDATDDDSPKGLGSTAAGYSSIPPEGRRDRQQQVMIACRLAHIEPGKTTLS